MPHLVTIALIAVAAVFLSIALDDSRVAGAGSNAFDALPTMTPSLASGSYARRGQTTLGAALEQAAASLSPCPSAAHVEPIPAGAHIRVGLEAADTSPRLRRSFGAARLRRASMLFIEAALQCVHLSRR
jgi:hypothetical protein